MKILMKLHKLQLTGRVNLPEYVKFMRIHEDSLMIPIEPHSCVYGMPK